LSTGVQVDTEQFRCQASEIMKICSDSI
jgi:hypothetical protein